MDTKVDAAVNPQVGGPAYALLGLALCAGIAILSTAIVVASTSVPLGAAMFVGIYQLPLVVPAVWVLKLRAPASLMGGFLFGAIIMFVLSGIIALLIGLGLLAA
jgi:hypothetical protein